jgi:hypothetical protein
MSSFGRHVVVFGGQFRGGAPSEETWVLRKSGWAELDLEPQPGARFEGVLVETRRGRAVLFGGYQGDYRTPWALHRTT